MKSTKAAPTATTTTATTVNTIQTLNSSLSETAVTSCSLLVVSCDRYRDLWTPFFHLFWKYWPDCPLPVFLGANAASFDDARVRTLHAAPGEPWSASLRYFLNQLDSDYVLLLLEDFFVSQPVSNADLLAQLAALKSLDGAVLRLNPNPVPNIKLKQYPEIAELHRLAPFRVSLQPSIWKRAALLALLRDAETPWEFELKGTLRAQAQPRGFYSTRRLAFPHRHVVEKGVWFWSAARSYRKLGIGCDFAARAVMGPLTAARKVIATFLRRTRGRLLMLPMRTPEPDPFADPPAGAPRVAILTNLIPPYHKPVLDLLSRRYAAMRVFLSTPMESNRPWKADWQGLDVTVQRTFTLKGTWRHPRGFSEPLAVHIPVDTLGQLARFSPQVVISAEMGARTLLAMLFRKLHPATRLIIWAEAAESTESGRGPARQIVRKILVRNADAFLAVGSSAVKYLSQIGADPAKIFKIAYTTDIERFAASPLSRREELARRLLFSGQLVERKGLVPFIEVLSRWAEANPDRQVELYLAGDGPLRPQLEKLPVAANVKLVFLGVFQYSDLPGIYAEAGVLVLPTLADTWAVVVNEALAAGLPVLGSAYAQAVEELIEDGENGWIFRPGQPGETENAIDRMLNTSLAKLDQMRERGRAAARNLSPERVASLIDAAVASCVDVRRRKN